MFWIASRMVIKTALKGFRYGKRVGMGCYDGDVIGKCRHICCQVRWDVGGKGGRLRGERSLILATAPSLKGTNCDRNGNFPGSSVEPTAHERPFWGLGAVRLTDPPPPPPPPYLPQRRYTHPTTTQPFEEDRQPRETARP
ncbi:hypothetical protein AAG570_002150 [Ranatra chinensis]|uniref:Uncharacterized protein n=1 Tax=Ranatra chinensis TaxID=642074 RepID=A0ABD0Y738_9HEMI